VLAAAHYRFDNAVGLRARSPNGLPTPVLRNPNYHHNAIGHIAKEARPRIVGKPIAERAGCGIVSVIVPRNL